MGTTIVAILSIFIQFAAAILAISLIRLTRPRWVWASIGIAIALLGLVHAFDLSQAPADTLSQTAYLLFSILIFIGLLGVRRLCQSYHSSVDRLSGVQTELDSALRRLGFVLNNAPIVFFAVDKTGVFTLSEGRGLEGLGLEPGEVVGLSVFDLYKDNPDIIESIRRALGGEEITAPIDVVDLSYESYYSPIRDRRGNVTGVFGVSVDVSRRKRSETQLRATKERFRALVETTSDCVWEIDTDAVYTYVGPKVKDLLGYEPDELIGRSPFELMTPEYASNMSEYFQTLSSKRKSFAGIVTIGRRKDGSTVILETSGVPVIGDDGELVGYRGIDRDITNRKAAEDALRSSERRLQLALVAANLGTWDWDIVKNDLAWSQKIEELFQIDIGSFDGKYETYLSLIHPDDRDHVQFAVGAALEGRVSPFRVLHRIVTRDGETRWMEAIGQVIRDESNKPTRMLGLVGDVTDREISERQLRMEKETAQTYLDTAGVIMLVADLSGNVELINRKGIEILGYSEHEIVGKSFVDFVPESSRNEIGQILAQVIGEETEQLDYYEMPVLSKAGEEHLIAWHSVAIKNDDGEVVGVLGSGSDLTERRQAERVKQELEDQLRHSQRMETIGTLAGGIAHDFNNILSPILGYTDMAMEDAGENGTIREYLDNVVRATHRAKELVEQILLFSKNVDQEASPIQLHLVIREGLKFVRASLPTTIEIQQNINIEAGVVLANSAQIHQVLVNLCTNAAYAMRDTGGILRVSLEPVEVDEGLADEHSALHPGPYARLTVSDTGSGMDPQTAERIFEPFFTTKAIGEGTGLGLSVVHGIVKGHGGEIIVDSEPGAGTTVTVYFPHTDKTVVETAVENVVATGTERVLFIDDEPDIAKLGERMLERLGYRVTTALNGDEALEIIRENPGGFDVVVTDQTMPRKTGLTLIGEIRDIRPDLPVILITGFSDMITPEKLEELDIGVLVMKPLTGKKLGAAIRRVLDINLHPGDG